MPCTRRPDGWIVFRQAARRFCANALTCQHQHQQAHQFSLHVSRSLKRSGAHVNVKCSGRPVIVPSSQQSDPVLIQFRALTLARGARRLIENLSLQIHSGWRLGVVGANGSGKSSLFALLRGGLHQDQGDLDIPLAWIIAQVAQETPALATPALDYALQGDAELMSIEQELATLEAEHHEGDHVGSRVGELHSRLLEIDG